MPLLVILFEPRTLVVHMQGGDDALGDHPRPEATVEVFGDAAGEDELHLLGSAQVQMFADDLFEEDAPGLWAVIAPPPALSLPSRALF